MWLVYYRKYDVCFNCTKIKNYEEALKLAQRIEKDNEGQVTISSTDNKLEDKLDDLQNSIMQLTLQKSHLWCTNCHREENKKDTCNFVDCFDQDVRRIQFDMYYDIYQVASNHLNKYL